MEPAHGDSCESPVDLYRTLEIFSLLVTMSRDMFEGVGRSAQAIGGQDGHRSRRGLSVARNPCRERSRNGRSRLPTTSPGHPPRRVGGSPRGGELRSPHPGLHPSFGSVSRSDRACPRAPAGRPAACRRPPARRGPACPTRVTGAPFDAGRGPHCADGVSAYDRRWPRGDPPFWRRPGQGRLMADLGRDRALRCEPAPAHGESRRFGAGLRPAAPVIRVGAGGQ